MGSTPHSPIIPTHTPHTSNMGKRKTPSKPAANPLPSKRDFLAFYFAEMVGRFNMMFDESRLSSGLSTKAHMKVLNTYEQCYKTYIKEEKAAPPKKFWRKHQTEPWQAAEAALTGLTKLERRQTTIYRRPGTCTSPS